MKAKMIRCALAAASVGSILAWPALASAEHARYRLSVRGDPATTMVIGWDQVAGEDPKVHWDTVDHGTDVAAYAHTNAPDRVVSEKGMNNHFVRLSGLTPDTAYYFIIEDSSGPSARYWFKTAPSTKQAFSVVMGGDSRNNREPRRNGNKAVAKLRPLLVFFGGDFTDSNSDTQWIEWFDDWQASVSADGRMYPMVATRGNHDSNATLEKLWDTPTPDVYYGVSVGGTLARFYTLNSEIAPGGLQGSWLAQDLAGHRCDTFRVAQYHRPMRPHTASKSEGSDIYDAWAELFFDEGVDLAVECDSHTVKRTWPIRPEASGGDDGFVRDDAKGTVYIGEGCWGAPLRPDDDAKSWTRAHGSFNEVNWVIFYPDRIELRTIPTDDIDQAGTVSDAEPFEPPANLPVWDAQGGSVFSIAARARDPRCGPEGTEPIRKEVITLGSAWRYHDQGQDLGSDWRQPEFDDSSWMSGQAQFGYGDGDETTPLNQTTPNLPSYYFRTDFELPLNGGSVTAADLRVVYDDGIAVWVNGTSAFTKDVGSLEYAAYATATIGDNGTADATIDEKLFRDGRNVVAVMVKQVNESSSDLSFDLGLTLTIVPPEGGAGGAGGVGPGSGGAGPGSGGSAIDSGAHTGGAADSGLIAPPGERPGTHPSASTNPSSNAGCGCSVPQGSPTTAGFACSLLAIALLHMRRRSATGARSQT